MQINHPLFDEFHKDHAVLGRLLYELRVAISDRDIGEARRIADQLDRAAGAHIAFEERAFYPALAPVLGQDEIDRMLREHQLGPVLIQDIFQLAEDPKHEATLKSAVDALETLEAHVSECGDLFGAMGALSDDEQKRLLKQLKDWRERAPRWTEVRAHST